jgi:hypothetical protein
MPKKTVTRPLTGMSAYFRSPSFLYRGNDGKAAKSSFVNMKGRELASYMGTDRLRHRLTLQMKGLSRITYCLDHNQQKEGSSSHTNEQQEVRTPRIQRSSYCAYDAQRKPEAERIHLQNIRYTRRRNKSRRPTS